MPASSDQHSMFYAGCTLMGEIREYLLRIVVCGVVCGIAVGLTGNSGASGKMVKLITGICMLITVINPIMQIRIDDWGAFLGGISADAEAFVEQGENVSAAALEEIIKAKTQAYILDKADSFGASLSVEIGLTDEQYPKPDSVRISGSISPYGKKQLQSIISNDLGIALEDQVWIG